MKYTCRICANCKDNTPYTCSEKMFGMGGEFLYFQCTHCGFLQMVQIPQDLSRYYPPHYHSYEQQPVPQRGWKAVLAGKRDYTRLTGSRWVRFWPSTAGSLRPDVVSLGKLPLQRGMRVLDVGCGRGQLLSVLHRAGFQHLAGIDPFLPQEVEVVPGVLVRKKALEAVQESFHLIMFHHVFEHIGDGRATLLACRKLLVPGGKILLRIPTVDSLAWERYRENWVQLDAPRHLCLHSRRSLELLAYQAGLVVERTWCDSATVQFWGSELYQSGRQLFTNSGKPMEPEHHFTAQQLRNFALETEAANAANRGDQLVAILAATGA